MLLDNLKENDVVVFEDGVCGKVTSCLINKDIGLITIVLDKLVLGVRGCPKKAGWTYWLDGRLWNAGRYNVNNIVKAIYA